MVAHPPSVHSSDAFPRIPSSSCRLKSYSTWPSGPVRHLEQPERISTLRGAQGTARCKHHPVESVASYSDEESPEIRKTLFPLGCSHILYSFLLNKVGGLWEQGGISLLPGLQVKFGRRQGASQAELSVDALHTVGRIDVLDQSDLVARGASLSGDDGRVRKEVLPDL